METIRKVIGGIYSFFMNMKIKKDRYRNYAVIFAGVMVIAVVSLNTVGFAGSGKNKVYAEQSGQSETSGDEDVTELETGMEHESIQAGLMGLVNSVNSMEEYSQAASCVDVENIYEEILVGTSKVKRNAFEKVTIGKNTDMLSGVGYFAKQTVRDNHMPTEDYYSLLQIVEAEATGGDLQSKILIANVVLNRVEDSRFPDKIYDVIWDRRGGTAQFSPTADGRIYSVAITEDTYEAVERALDGEDYSEGALFFVARASAESHNVEWFDENLNYLFEHGGHEYYKFMDE